MEKKKNTYKGFSILEILVVLSVFVLVAVISSQILFSTLRSTKKAEVTSLVKQNGNYAISVIQRAIYNSRSIVECAGDRITYIDADGVQASFACLTTTPGSIDYIASESARGQSRLSSEAVRISTCSIQCFPSTIPREVEISFDLEGKGGEATFKQTKLHFQTRVVLRN